MLLQKKSKLKPFSTIFPRFFHDLCQKSRNITKYQFLLIQPFLASNQDKKLVLRAGLEPTTLCLEGRCSIQLSYRSKQYKCTALSNKCRHFSGGPASRQLIHSTSPEENARTATSARKVRFKSAGTRLYTHFGKLWCIPTRTHPAGLEPFPRLKFSQIRRANSRRKNSQSITFFRGGSELIQINQSACFRSRRKLRTTSVETHRSQ